MTTSPSGQTPSPGAPRRLVVGVMGAGDRATPVDTAAAERLGALIARRGWAVLTGGRDAGVMGAACRGARQVPGSLTVGILPGESGGVCPEVDLAVFTGMGAARNVVNVLSSDVVVACGRGGPGTASEVSLALKLGRPVVLMAPQREAEAFFRSLGGRLAVVSGPDEAVDAVARLVRGVSEPPPPPHDVSGNTLPGRATVFVATSKRFYGAAGSLVAELEGEGFSVHHPYFDLDPGAVDADPARKAEVTRRHLPEIDASDVLYALVPGGYTGASVILEVTYAFARGKRVLTSEPSAELAVRALVDEVCPPGELVARLGRREARSS